MKKNHYSNERGSALVYILIAIALLAALTVAFMNPSSNQTSSQNMFKTVSELQSQVDFIRSAVQECVLLYPRGDDGLDAAGAPLPDQADIKNIPYPLMSNVDYLDNCGANPAEAAGEYRVERIRCPGNPGDDPCHADMFGSTSGKFLPPAPDLFSDFKYYNGDDGVFIWTETTASDAFIDTAFTKIDESYAFCEADVIDATGGDEDLTSDMIGNVICPDGSKCLRLWLITRATAVYVAGTPENDGAGDECP